MKIVNLIFLVLLTIPSFAFAQTYEIKFKNRSNQTLTSAVCAIHNRKAALFAVGEAATEGLAELAEDGDESGFLQETRNKKGVRTVKTGPFVSGKSRETIEISTKRARGRLSCVFGMLVATNDAFPAFQNLKLPRKVGAAKRIRAFAYDAGSEVNTESCDHVPGGPCDAHFVGIEENGTVERHAGIQGIADLSVEQHGWREPVVRGRVVRIN